jgi:hypothetical protein
MSFLISDISDIVNVLGYEHLPVLVPGELYRLWTYDSNGYVGLRQYNIDIDDENIERVFLRREEQLNTFALTSSKNIQNIPTVLLKGWIIQNMGPGDRMCHILLKFIIDNKFCFASLNFQRWLKKPDTHDPMEKPPKDGVAFYIPSIDIVQNWLRKFERIS